MINYHSAENKNKLLFIFHYSSFHSKILTLKEILIFSSCFRFFFYTNNNS